MHSVEQPRLTELPVSLPTDPNDPLLCYFAHVGLAMPMRALARVLDCHPSSVLRRVRKAEALRDDVVIDRVFDRITQHLPSKYDAADLSLQEISKMVTTALNTATVSTAQLEREARRILRRLCEKGAFLAVSRGLDTAVVFRDSGAGAITRIAVCPTPVVEGFLVQDWISTKGRGKVVRYTITSAGESALKRILAHDHSARQAKAGYAQASEVFAKQHREFGERAVMSADGTVETIRVNLAESPLGSLARRKGPDGKPFLGELELTAGEKLREDFERAQMGPNVAQNWDRFLTPTDRGTMGPSNAPVGPQDAKDRVTDALRALGPGLGDIAMRCCCFLEGLEAAEKRLGWSARSGKVVLKIALQRLADHYRIGQRKQSYGA